MPSLSPLSTFKLCRTRDGSRGSVTTACPSAASVGASTTARRSASGQLSAPRSATAAAKPATSVSGSPMPSRRGDGHLPAEGSQVDARGVGEEDHRETPPQAPSRARRQAPGR